MKRLSIVLAVAMLWVALAGTAHAWWSCDEHPWACAPHPYDESESHPLRLIAYFVHPIGFAAEWLIARPIHYVVSQPYAADVFGYRPEVDEAAVQY